MKSKSIEQQLKELRGKVNCASIKRHNLPEIDLTELSSQETQQAHDFLMSKLMDYVIEQGNDEALDFLAKKTQAYYALHKPGKITNLIDCLNQSDEKEWYEALLKSEIDALIIKLADKTVSTEAWFVNSFREVEPSLIWKESVQKEVIEIYQQIGEILSIAQPVQLLNALPQNKDRALMLEQLGEMRKENKFVYWLENHNRVFYQGMGQILDKSIDAIGEQVQRDPSIEKILKVVERGLDEFLDYRTEDFSFGDTEDREAVGAYYCQIMEILGISSSRGLLSEKLE